LASRVRKKSQDVKLKDKLESRREGLFFSLDLTAITTATMALVVMRTLATIGKIAPLFLPRGWWAYA
jgi:hypothetical protein